jgi:hypothetical protein
MLRFQIWDYEMALVGNGPYLGGEKIKKKELLQLLL